jgi:hypothetical protein
MVATAIDTTDRGDGDDRWVIDRPTTHKRLIEQPIKVTV